MTNRIQLYKIKLADGTYLQNSLFNKDWQGALGESRKQARYLLGTTIEPGDIRVERPVEEVLAEYKEIVKIIGYREHTRQKLPEQHVLIAKDLEQEILLGYWIEVAPEDTLITTTE